MGYKEWKTDKLGNILTLKRGYDLPQQHRIKGTVPIYSSAGLTGFHNESKVKGPGVITGRYGTLGEVFYTERDYWPHNTTLYVKDFKGSNPKFISYFLKTIGLATSNDKTSVPGLNRNDIHEMNVSIPNLKNQIQIACILSSLDEKIELNRQTNQTLEAIAQTLFKEMCVPKSEELLEGWKIEKLKDIVEFVVDNRGKTPSTSLEKNNNFPLIEVNALVNCCVVTNVHLAKKFVTKEVYESWFRKGHPQKGDVLISTVGTIGEVSLVQNEKFCIAQNIIALRSAFYGSFIYFYLKSIKIELLSLDVSSVQPSIKVPHLLDYKILLPNINLVVKFSEKVGDLLDLIYLNEQNTRTLITIRDSLLSKLMKGEIKINL